MTDTYVILPGMKDRLGRIYSREQLEPYLGTEIYGHLGTVFTDKIELDRVSHVVKDIRIEDGDLVGTVTVMATPTGKMLQEMINEECAVHLSMQAIDKVNKDWTVSDLKICSINMLAGKGE